MEEVNLQTFVMILCKIFCRNFLYINTFILFLGLKKKKKKKNISNFPRSKNDYKSCRNRYGKLKAGLHRVHIIAKYQY